MKLSNLTSNSNSLIGSEAYFQPISDVIVIGNAEYLKAGLALVNEQANYPELYEIFAVGNRVTSLVPRPLANGEILNYMRIK